MRVHWDGSGDPEEPRGHTRGLRLAREAEPEAPRHPPQREAETLLVVPCRRDARRERTSTSRDYARSVNPMSTIQSAICILGLRSIGFAGLGSSSTARCSRCSRVREQRTRVDRPRRRESTCSRRRPGHTQIRPQRPDRCRRPAAGHSRPASNAARTTFARGCLNSPHPRHQIGAVVLARPALESGCSDRPPCKRNRDSNMPVSISGSRRGVDPDPPDFPRLEDRAAGLRGRRPARTARRRRAGSGRSRSARPAPGPR